MCIVLFTCLLSFTRLIADRTVPLGIRMNDIGEHHLQTSAILSMLVWVVVGSNRSECVNFVDDCTVL